MRHLRCDTSKDGKVQDVVYTPDYVASAIISRYCPSGSVLDPCAGDGAFSSRIPGCLTCEIKDGRDFFEFRQRVDWIVGNPPYSILNAWLEHQLFDRQ